MIQVSLLGGLSIEADGRVFDDFPRRKAAALLALLALRPRQKHAREELAAALWPDASAEAGRANLRQALVHLHRATDGLEIVRADAQTLQLCEGVAIDTLQFEAALRAGAVERAAALWRGELLPGFFEEPILTERERLNALKEHLPEPGPVPAPLPSNLPLYLTPLLGRERELEALAQLLRIGRLVTITGPGGIGKTRLAVQLAREAKREAVFVDLAALPPGADEGRLLQAVAEALGVPPSGGESLGGSLPRLLVARPLLLILDNAEHVLAGSAALALRLLATAGPLLLLVTSREPLHLPGEQILALEPLAPEDAERLLQSVARATRADLPDDPQALSAICARLDGVPLALELAAAQCAVLSLREIADELELHPMPPARPSAGAPPRHHSLEATLRWSDALLTESQRRALLRLSCFVGGGERAAVLDVCEASPTDLAALVEKSLVQAQMQPDTPTRYRCLEPVRQWAAVRLKESGDEAATRLAHARWFLALAEKAAPHLRRFEQLYWLQKLDADRANLDAAFAVLPPPEKLRLAAALKDYWNRRGYHTEGLARLEEALGACQERSEARARALLGTAELRMALGPRTSIESIVASVLACTDDPLLALEARLHAIEARDTGNITEMREWVEPILSEIGDNPALRWHRAVALMLIGRDPQEEGCQREHLALQREAVRLFEEVGDHYRMLEALSFAIANLLESDLEAGTQLAYTLQELAARHDTPYFELVASRTLLLQQRTLPEADLATMADLVRRLTALTPRLLVAWDALAAWHCLLHACRYLGRWAEAAHAAKQALYWHEYAPTLPPHHVYQLSNTLSLLADFGDVERGGRLYGFAMAERERLKMPLTKQEARVYTRDVACLRATDAAGFEAAQEKGRTLTIEEAIAIAHDLPAPPPDGTKPLLPPI